MAIVVLSSLTLNIYDVLINCMKKWVLSFFIRLEDEKNMCNDVEDIGRSWMMWCRRGWVRWIISVGLMIWAICLHYYLIQSFSSLVAIWVIKL